MKNITLFALPDLKPLDPEIEGIFVFALGVFGVAFVGLVLWVSISTFVPKYRNKRAEKIRHNNNVWFDADETTLHRGSQQFKVQANSIEFYVCKLVFEERTKYQLDIDILEAAGDDPLKPRAVYQAVVRLNKKVKSELGIDELFVRVKEKTGLNTKYR